MADATLTINSRNYGAWSLRGWLLCKMSGLDFDEHVLDNDDPDTRAELLLLSSSFLVPKLVHDGVTVWDTMAIGEYLNEVRPDAGLLPSDRVARAHCRAVCGEIHSGFVNLRSALPMNLKASTATSRCGRARRPTSTASRPSGASASTRTADRSCSATRRPSPTRCTRRCARASAPTTSSSTTSCSAYCDAIMSLPAMKEWIAAASARARRARGARRRVLNRARHRGRPPPTRASRGEVAGRA